MTTNNTNINNSNSNDTNGEVKKNANIQSELCLVGSLYTEPDLYVSYGKYMRSQYDFSDEATKFFYDSFELMYTTFSQNFDENKVNTFMTQNDERLRMYKKYKGWRTISSWKALADVSDFENYYNMVKKYSLVREYERQGYPIQKILNNSKFEKWKANDIYKIIRSMADKINTIINANEESVDLTDGISNQIQSKLCTPDMGIPFPWKLLTEMFRGARLRKVVFNGFLSNEGKTRNLMLICAYIVLVLDEKFLLLSNEMDEEDLKNCLITTVINNKEFQQYHGVDITKCEREIVLGIYRDDNGEVIQRYVDDNGNFTETEADYIKRINDTSEEYRKIQQVANWIDDKRNGKLLFKDVGSDYSDSTLEMEFR